MKPVLLIWEDAGDLDEGPWTERKEAKPSEPFIFHQVGYLYELTPEAVVLTQCVGTDQMSPRTRIPIGMVRSLVELNEGQPVKIPKKRTKKVRGD
jgi:hypothetical protein